MKSRKVTMYYCDFCSKKGQQQPRMIEHMKSCTNNPERECGICHGKCQRSAAPLPALIAFCRENALEGVLKPEKLEALRELADTCPACMLAAIRQSGIAANWDYPTESARFWDEHNKIEHDERLSVGGVY